jgi:hypothetical protein
MGEHQSALRLNSVCRLTRHRILTVDAARANDVAYPTCCRDRIYMLETVDIDALSTSHFSTSFDTCSIQTSIEMA